MEMPLMGASVVLAGFSSGENFKFNNSKYSDSGIVTIWIPLLTFSIS